MSLPNQKSTPIILHLSDLHLGSDKRINPASGSKSALDYLYEDLEKLKKKPEADLPNVVVISGDLTTKYDSKEYSNAKDFIEKIRKLFKLDFKNICVIPGNHDVSLQLRREFIKNTTKLPPYIYEEEFVTNIGPDLIKKKFWMALFLGFISGFEIVCIWI